MKWALSEGFRLHVYLIKTGCSPTLVTANKLIHLYSKHGYLKQAQQLFDKMPERNVFTWNAIIYAYIHNQDLSKARTLFDSAPIKDSVTYNSIISGYANTPGYEKQAFEILSKVHETESRFDEFTLTTMLNLTAKLSVLSYGMQLHSYMVKTANDVNVFATSSLIDMYSKCGCFKEAVCVFELGNGKLDLVSKNALVAACCREGEMEMACELFWRFPEVNDPVSWNTLIAGYAQNGFLEKGMELFVQMGSYGIRPNEHTFTSVLSACSNLRSEKHGREIHAWVLKNDLSSNPYISSGVVDMYCKCENLIYAESANAASGDENAFSITSLVVGHSSEGNMVDARKLFGSLKEKNSVVWTALFFGYVRIRDCDAVFELFLEYNKSERVVPDVLVLISVLSACAIQAALHPGRQIHTYILRMGFEMEEKLSSSMLDMYAKCGQVLYAERIFQKARLRDKVLYNVMMAGYAHHGYENKAIGLFEEMLSKSNVKPDAVTFIALVSACRHAGLVELGEKYFASMMEDYGISPESDHYSCMVDLYGRGNCLDKAVDLIKKIPFEPDAVIWGSFVNACKRNGSTKLLREAEEKLLRADAHNGARYVQLANVYAAEGDWGEMCRIRRKMRGEVQKLTGCSWVYVENRVNIFTSGDRSHSQAEGIYTMLASLNTELGKAKRLLT